MELVSLDRMNRNYRVTDSSAGVKHVTGTLAILGNFVIIGQNVFYKPLAVVKQP